MRIRTAPSFYIFEMNTKISTGILENYNINLMTYLMENKINGFVLNNCTTLCIKKWHKFSINNFFCMVFGLLQAHSKYGSMAV